VRTRNRPRDSVRWSGFVLDKPLDIAVLDALQAEGPCNPLSETNLARLRHDILDLREEF